MVTKRKHRQLCGGSGGCPTVRAPPIPVAAGESSCAVSPLCAPSSSPSSKSNAADWGPSSQHVDHRRLCGGSGECPTASAPPSNPIAVGKSSCAVSLLCAPFQKPNKRGRRNESNAATYNDSLHNEQDDDSQSGATNTSSQCSLPRKFLPPVQLRSGEKPIEKLRRKIGKMMRLDDRKKENPEHSDRLDKLHELLIAIAVIFHENYVTEDGIEMTPLTTENQEDNGVYDWEVNGKRRTIGETGRSYLARGKERLDGEADVSASQVRERMNIIYTTTGCLEILGMPHFKSHYEQIAGMYLPRLQFHAENEQLRKEKISRQIMEGIVAANSSAFNLNAFECLTDFPSVEIQNIVRIPDENQDCADITREAKIIIPVYTWGTKASYIRELMKKMAGGKDGKALSSEQHELLHRIVRPPHNDGFLQNHQFKRVIGGNNLKMLQFVDGVDSKDNPQVKELLKVVHDLNSLLTAEGVIDRFLKDGYIPQNIQDEVKEIVNKISEGDYQSPADDVLIASSTEKLSKLLNNYKDCGNEVMIVIEACLFDKLDDHTRKNLFPDGYKIFLQRDIDGDVAEHVIQTPNGPNLKIMHSSHIAFGEKNTSHQRIKSVKRMIASMSLNKSAGILDEEAFDNEIKIFTCFLMIWFGYGGSSIDRKGSFYGARNVSVGEGICSNLFAREGVKMTANQIGDNVSAKDAVILRCFLGLDRFNAVLTCCGKATSQSNLSPLDDTKQIEVWKRERQKEYNAEYNARPEVRERQKEYNAEYNARPEVRERQKEYHARWYAQPEVRKRRKEYNARWNAQPEVRERRNEQMRVYNARMKEQKRSNKEEQILHLAKIALKKYVELLNEENLKRLTRDVLKPLVDYFVLRHPKSPGEKLSEYNNVAKMMNRLGITYNDKEDQLTRYIILEE